MTKSFDKYIIPEDLINGKVSRKMKEHFLELLRGVKREGIEELIQFMEKTDFFKAPASTRFHGDYEGGLVEHSLKVYEILKHKVETNIEKIDASDDSIKIICG